MALSSLHIELPEVEELLSQRGLDISYETIRQWARKFGQQFARQLRARRPARRNGRDDRRQRL
jgi:putative transposase